MFASSFQTQLKAALYLAYFFMNIYLIINTATENVAHTRQVDNCIRPFTKISA